MFSDFNPIKRVGVALAGVVPLLVLMSYPALALDKVVWKPKPDAEAITSAGRALVLAEDGGLLLQTRDGMIEAIEPQMIVKATRSDEPFVPMTQDEVGKALLEKMPKGFQIHKTEHYIVCYNTSRTYARWCGSLMENLYTVFTTYWKGRGKTLLDPEFPLVMVVFADVRQYKEYGKDDLGDAADAIIGYYHFSTNQVVCYDISGREMFAKDRGNLTYTSATREILRRPGTESQIATIIHEATHQLSFNRGLMQRYADVPLWVNEGVSLVFEVPDLKNPKGWKGTVKLNPLRLPRYREYLRRRPEDALRRILTDDNLFRDLRSSEDAYAESWALTYYLLRIRREQFIKYIDKISTKRPLHWENAETRIRDFEECFGSLETLERTYLNFMKKQ